MDMEDMLHVCQLLNLNLIHNFVSNIKGHISICVDKRLVCRARSTSVGPVVAGLFIWPALLIFQDKHTRRIAN